MATIRDIATRAGVSRGTVDRVINGRPGVSLETETVIRALMDEMGYRPNLAGKMLAGRKKHLRLAFLAAYGPEFIFFADVLRGAPPAWGESPAPAPETTWNIHFVKQQPERPHGHSEWF